MSHHFVLIIMLLYFICKFQIGGVNWFLEYTVVWTKLSKNWQIDLFSNHNHVILIEHRKNIYHFLDAFYVRHIDLCFRNILTGVWCYRYGMKHLETILDSDVLHFSLLLFANIFLWKILQTTKRINPQLHRQHVYMVSKKKTKKDKKWKTKKLIIIDITSVVTSSINVDRFVRSLVW